VSEAAPGVGPAFDGHEAIRDWLFGQVATDAQLRGKVSFVGETEEEVSASFFTIETAGSRCFIVGVISVER